MKASSDLAAFLDDLRSRNRITLNRIDLCARQHAEEIKDMKRIFRLETEEDIRRCLTLPALLDPENQDILIDYIKEKHNRDDIAGIFPDTEKYKELLITAFFHNHSFFAMAWNWCALYRGELRESLRKTAEIPGLDQAAGESGSVVINFPVIFYLAWHVAGRRAGPEEPGFRRFGEPYELEGNFGTIGVYGAEMGGHYYTQFCFVPKTNRLPRPYYVDIQFTAGADKVSRTMRIRDDAAESRDSPIWSEPSAGKDVDYTRGITIDRVTIDALPENLND